jgi:hypothetical protein
VRGLVDDVKHLPSVDNAIIAGIGGGGALTVHPYDGTFNVRLRSHYDVVNDVFAPAKYFGASPEQMGMALATWAYGRLFDEPKVSHLGMDLLRAQIVSQGLTEAVKLSAGRERPDHSNHQSFPSGHASITFAGATVLERHLGWKRSAVAYIVASYVAASRLHDNRHYLSDVVFGAAVGTIAGRTVVVGHGPATWTFAPVNVPGGGMILVVRRAKGAGLRGGRSTPPLSPQPSALSPTFHRRPCRRAAGSSRNRRCPASRRLPPRRRRG